MHFSPLWFRLDFSQIYSLFVSLLKKIVPALKRATLLFALFVLTSRANCDQLIPFPFSAKNPSFHWEVSLIAQSQQRKKSPHKKTVYQSRQSRRVLLCQATSVWVLPRESQTSRIIPTTTPPLQLVVKSRRKEDLLLLYCYYIFIYYIHRHFHTLSHTHTNRKHTIQWYYDELTAADERQTSPPPHPPSQRASTIPTTYLYRSTMLSRSLIYERHYLLLAAGRPSPTSSILPPHSIQVFIRTQRIHKC